jgi:hypothetical protein
MQEDDRLKKIAELKAKILEEEKEVLFEIAQEQALNELPKFETPKPDKSFYASVPKKVAAMEVTKHITTARLFLIGGIVGVFASLLGYIVNVMLGFGFALIASVALGYHIMSINKEIARLKQEYGV